MCILVLKKCKRTDDVLVINAAEHYQPSKRQNALSPEHIEKIIETYKYRNEEGRYSRRVSLKEIEEEHDFNLNISRFVSTAELEEQIELESVNKRLADLQKTVTSAAEQHNSFLEELGLPKLPT